MAVDWINEVMDGRTSSKDTTLTRRYARVFLIKMTKAADGPRGARLALRDDATYSIEIGDTYPAGGDTAADALAFVTNVDVVTVDAEQFVYKATVQYESRNPATVPDPRNRAKEVRWSLAVSQEPYDEDTAGNPVQNSAGVKFEAPPEREVASPVVTITRNEAVPGEGGGTWPEFSPSVIGFLQGKVNSSTWSSFAPGQARLANIGAEKLYEYGVYYWRVTYEVHLRQDGWDHKVRNEGYNALVWDATATPPAWILKAMLVKDEDGNMVQTPEPLPLAADGTRLPQGGTPTYSDPPFKPYLWISFALIPTPD